MLEWWQGLLLVGLIVLIVFLVMIRRKQLVSEVVGPASSCATAVMLLAVLRRGSGGLSAVARLVLSRGVHC